MRDHLYKTETDKKPAIFAKDLKIVMKKHGFIIGNEEGMNMNRTFTNHGGEVGLYFDLHD